MMENHLSVTGIFKCILLGVAPCSHVALADAVSGNVTFDKVQIFPKLSGE